MRENNMCHLSSIFVNSKRCREHQRFREDHEQRFKMTTGSLVVLVTNVFESNYFECSLFGGFIRETTQQIVFNESFWAEAGTALNQKP